MSSIVPFSKDVNPNVRVLRNSYTLSNLQTLLSVADEYKFGVMACNIRSKHILNAVLKAAWDEKSPVIVEISESEVSYCNMSPLKLSDLVHERIEIMIEEYGYSVPVCLHYDHVQKDIEGCVSAAISAGFSSLELDLSKLPLDENIEKCKKVVEKVHSFGISLEVEDGEIGNADALADPDVEKNIAQYYSKVSDCQKLCEEVKPDALAFFVGNGHGQYLKKPIIGYQRIKEICDTVRPFGVYGVMHGGSGLLPEDFNMCIESGARKFNYATSLSDIWFNNFPKDLLKRMDEKASSMNTARRKVLYLFADEIAKLDHVRAEEEIADHLKMMMKIGFTSSGKAELYE